MPFRLKEETFDPPMPIQSHITANVAQQHASTGITKNMDR